jgi:hypothetical protein
MANGKNQAFVAADATYMATKTNTKAADDSGDHLAHGEKLVAAETPFRRAVITAVKAGANVYTPGVANTGTVYLARADSLVAAIPLPPGSSFELIGEADLFDWYLIITTAADGVVITYTR